MVAVIAIACGRVPQARWLWRSPDQLRPRSRRVAKTGSGSWRGLPSMDALCGHSKVGCIAFNISSSARMVATFRKVGSLVYFRFPIFSLPQRFELALNLVDLFVRAGLEIDKAISSGVNSPHTPTLR